ncbi:MAG: hypothetical protein B5M54_02560 [Candidatus Aminicenantes bacterium 4484_214]|nr:MAG: hypothetical protein B5M54_02560 [Candidatus Aminicenantes bacterium 4484_214]RLE10811.1 MAG: hypothetical protein DRJ06_00675 [Candidatus Aminicenantes bacterium]
MGSLGNWWLSKGERVAMTVFLGLLIVFVIFYFSRHLADLSLWMDEGFHTIATQEILAHGYPLFPSGHIYYKAILYTYVLSLFSLLFGFNSFTLRLVSVLATAAAIPFIFAFTRKLFNKIIAVGCVVLFVFSLWVVENARLALYFSPLLFICIVGYYFFYLGFFEEKTKYKILTTVVFLLAPLVHQLGMSLWFSFLALFFIRGAGRFFKKDVLLSFASISLFYFLIQLHEFFFWKVGYVYEKTELSFQGMMDYFFSGFSLGYFKELFRSFPAMSLFVLGGTFIALVKFIPRPFPGNRGHFSRFNDNWLFVALCLFFPLIFLGFFRTHVQPRYLYQLYPFFLILFVVTVYVLSQAVAQLMTFSFSLKNPLFQKMISGFVFIFSLWMFSDQVSLAGVKRVVNRYYNDPIPTDTITRSGRFEHYDHQGVGEFVKHHLQPDDIVVAIHVVFQYIYVGRVDYWLWSGGPGTWDAWEKTPEGWKDFYVGARWINNLQDLKSLIENNSGRRIWIITSPSLYRLDHINHEIRKFIQQDPRKLVFLGKDGLSGVYLWSDTQSELSQDYHSIEGEWIPLREGKIVFSPLASKKAELFLSRQRNKRRIFKYQLPYDLPPGRYQVVVKYKISEAEREPWLGLSIRTKTRRAVAEHRFYLHPSSSANNYSKVTGSFRLDSPAKLDFLFLQEAGYSLSIDWINIIDEQKGHVLSPYLTF